MSFTHSLAHFVFPSHTNNQRAKLLHTSSILLVMVALVSVQVILTVIPAAGIGILGYAANIPASRVIELSNQKRSEAGVLPLSVDDSLTKAARDKGEHMLENNYWAHVAPDGTEPWHFFLTNGYKYKFAGENLARDFSNPESAVEAWMASPSHKDNLLSTKYDEVGIAVVEGDLDGVDTTIIVQLFGSRSEGETAASIAQAGVESDSTTAPTPTISATPSPAPTTITKPEEQTLIPAVSTEGNGTTNGRGFLSPFTTTQAVSLFTIIALLGVLVVDGIITHKRGTARVTGRSVAHFAFLGMILSLVIIAKAGQIL